MFCTRCGAQSPDNAAFCVKCGSAFVQSGAIVNKPEEKNVAGMILGIVSTALGGFSLCCLYMGLMFSIPAIICASIGKNRGSHPHKLTTVGFWLGIAGTIVSVFWIFFYICLFIFASM